MSAELLVNVTPRETRVALIESGVLQEVFVERANRRGLVGNIYKGRVCRVLPGMQAAFVDVGLDRAAFLHASDIADAHARQVRDAPASEEGMTTPARTEPAPAIRNGASITDLVRDGQEVLVQVIKDPLGTKGARLTTQVSIPSCYLVYMPDAPALGVSQRIEDEEERRRLRDLVRNVARRHADTGSTSRTPSFSPPAPHSPETMAPDHMPAVGGCTFTPGPGSTPGPDFNAGSGSTSAFGSGIDSAPAPDSDPAPAPDSDPAPAPDSDPAPAPDSDPAPAPDSDPAPAPDSDSAPAPDSDPAPAPDSDPAPAPDSGSVPAFDPNPDSAGDEGESWMPEDGYIVRTAAEKCPEAIIEADMAFLRRLWESVREHVASVNGPGVVHEDLPLVIRTLRELSATPIERVRIDSPETLARVLDFTDRFLPEMSPRIELFAGERPIFDLYSVEDEIQKALHRKVQLKSGGHVVIDQTEAMTTIDVNTGGFVGHRNLEETIFKTNLEAAQTIARQLRLRNLGGMIIIDFIDMGSEAHKRQVLRALEKALDRDHTRTHVSSVSPLGLVEMTRKRTRESLEHVLCDPCPTCNARGSIKSAETVCYEIFREILREARQFDTERLLVIASPDVADRLVDEESSTFAELEESIGKPITLQVENLYVREQYDVVLM